MNMLRTEDDVHTCFVLTRGSSVSEVTERPAFVLLPPPFPEWLWGPVILPFSGNWSTGGTSRSLSWSLLLCSDQWPAIATLLSFEETKFLSQN